jgi:hypothetical protein
MFSINPNQSIAKGRHKLANNQFLVDKSPPTVQRRYPQSCFNQSLAPR